MPIQRLSKLNDWRLKDKHQNLIGRELRTRDGELLGSIADMVVDTDARLVTSIVLMDGRHIATEDINIEHGKAVLHTSPVYTGDKTDDAPPHPSATPRPDGTRVYRHEPPERRV